MDISLNKEQELAVKTTEGPVLVLSGAGTGKTRVLTARVAHIIKEGYARPWECLAVTFTNRAAKEMKERLNQIIGSAADSVWLGTFHSIGLKILRRNAEILGFNTNFVILAEDDQIRLLKQIMLSEALDVKKIAPEAVMTAIQSWKDKGITPEKVLSGDRTDFMGGTVLALYRLYQERLKAMNAMDFGDLLLLCLELLKVAPEVLKKYQNQFRYIMVDEYQDTNTCQYLWLRLLAQKYGNLCCVGDDDQSIYSWRGAEIANILKFDKDFKDAKIIRLESNYRSSVHILAAASGIIRNNNSRLGKELRVAEGKLDVGEKVKVKGVWSGREEAAFAVEVVEENHRQGVNYADMAILLRTTAQTREFEEAFITNAIPYQVIGGAKFYEREEIRDAIAYLRAVVMPSDDMAFLRIINKPRRGIGDATLDIIKETALAERKSFFVALQDSVKEDAYILKTAAKRNVVDFLDSYGMWQTFVQEFEPAVALENILNASGYFKMWHESTDIKAEGKLENLSELIAVLKERFEDVGAFLEHVALISDTDDIQGLDKVSLMTLHSAKGLEFNTVVLAGWEEGLFPHQRAIDEKGEKGVEEERRLAYVGLTRAKHKAYISYAANRMVYNQWQNNIPSRFLEELPPEHIQILGLPASFKTYVPINNPKKQTFIPKTQKIEENGKIKVGCRVNHKLFGFGIVAKLEGEKATVFFEKVGKKSVQASYVEPM